MTPFDPADPAFLADPYPVYAAMRAAGGVHPAPAAGGHRVDRGHTARLAPAVALRADALVRDLVSGIADGEAADLVTGVAEPLPVAVIADLLGVPESERAPLRGWSDAIVRMYEPGPGDDARAAAERASADFVALLRGLVARLPGRTAGADRGRRRPAGARRPAAGHDRCGRAGTAAAVRDARLVRAADSRRVAARLR